MTRNTFIDVSFLMYEGLNVLGEDSSQLSVEDLGLEVCCSVLSVLVFYVTKGC